MNMLGLGNSLGFGNMLGGSNIVSQLFSGTNSIFGSGFNMFGDMFGTGSCGLFMDCKGNYNYDAMAGVAVGSTLLQFAGAAIGQAIENKQDNSVENLEADVEECQKDVETKQKTVETREKELKTLEGETSEFQSKADTAKSKYNEANNYIITNKAAYNAAIAKKNNNENLNETEKNIIATYEEYDGKLSSLKTNKDTAEANLENHLNNIESKKREIERAKEEAKKAQEKLKAAQEAVQEAKLNKADGNMLNRTSEKRFNELFTTNASGNETLDPEAKISKADVRFAVLGYKNAKTDEDRKAWAKKFQILYNKLDTTDANNKNISAAYEIIKKDF